MYFAKVLFLYLMIAYSYCAVTFEVTDHCLQSDNEKVKVEVYYEVLCPGCKDFFINRLVPTVHDIGNYMDVQMIPYGNAETVKTNGKYQITCQHGPPECYGNMLHGCAVQLLKNNTLATLLNGCMMEPNVGSDDETLKTCATKFNVDPKEIINCANSEEGIEMLAKYGEATQKTGIQFVPYIILNGSAKDQENTNSHIKEKICKLLKNPPPNC